MLSLLQNGGIGDTRDERRCDAHNFSGKKTFFACEYHVFQFSGVEGGRLLVFPHVLQTADFPHVLQAAERWRQEGGRLLVFPHVLQAAEGNFEEAP